MPDPMSSPDPVVRSAAERRDALDREAGILDRVLAAYVSCDYEPSVPVPEVSPLEHYMFTEGASCGCAICVEWKTRHLEFVSSSKLVPKGHRWSTCTCDACRFVGRMHLNALAAANRRDLLIETSFHARYHSLHGSLVMDWVRGEIAKPAYTDNWCAQEMGRYPLERWFRKCQAAIGPVVSGEVFRGGAMSVDAMVHFASSLSADGYLAA